jgi:hypothetical protein
MDACSSCGYEVLPDEDFCTSCGDRYNRAQAQKGQGAASPAAATGFSNPAVAAVTAQLDAKAGQPQVASAPRGIPHVPPPAPREYRDAPNIGGWSFFDRTRFRWGGAGDIVLGIALIGSGHSAGSTIFGLLFIALGIATWIITHFGVRGHDEFNGSPYSAWNSMSTNGRAVAGTGSVIGVVFIYILFFWFFIILWVIKTVAA